MTLTAAMVKEAARAAGAGDVGIANVERFANAPQRMHPKNIFPDCRSVITIVQPIPRGTYRGITEGTHWANYTFYSYNRLNTIFRPRVTYKTACFIEDRGYEAVPVYPGVPECPGMNAPVAPGRPAPDINLNVRIAAVACGLGQIGWSKVFIHPKFGPRVRLGTILTDAELEPDPLFKGKLCSRCMRCAKECPGNAIPLPGQKATIQIKIEDQLYEWGDVHMGRCTLTHHGLNRDCSPFLQKDVPGLDLKVRDSDISQESAYRMTYPLGMSEWRKTPESEAGAVVGYYKQILDHVGYFAVCGAKGCIRGCMAHLEKTKKIEQCKFPTAVFSRAQWTLPPAAEDRCGGVSEGKFPAQYTTPDTQAGSWQ